MDLRFEDHADYQRGAIWCAAGGAALATLGSLPLAVAGSAFALTLGCATGPWRPRIVAACACAAAAVAWALAPRPWSAPACGAVLGLLFAAARAEAARRSGALPPSRLAVALAIATAMAVLGLAAVVLPYLSFALATFVPASMAAGVSGAVLGLWAALSAAPLHLRPLEVAPP
jgi:hypothetical protein